MRARSLGIVCCSTALSFSMGALAQPTAPAPKPPAAQPSTPPGKATPGSMKKIDPKPATPAGQPAAGDAEAGMKAMMEAGAPGEMHQFIARTAGAWDATVKMMMPGGPPDSKAVMTTVMVLGGRFAHSTVKGDFGGMPFEGAATLGYNTITGKFEGAWIDNMGTGTMFTTGTLDKDKKVLTMSGEFADPMTRATMKQREVMTVVSDNQMRDEIFHSGADGKEMKVMEITYTRAAAPVQKSTKDNDRMDRAVHDAAGAVKDAVPARK